MVQNSLSDKSYKRQKRHKWFPHSKQLTYNEGKDVRHGKVSQVHVGGRPAYIIV